MKFLFLLVFTFVTSLSFGKEIKEWTIYIHLNADNNLCPYASKDLAEIQSLDVSDSANVIIAFDCDKKEDSKLMEVKGQEVTVLKTGEFDMGDSKFFQETADEVFTNYPSQKRMVVLWNHGSGWRYRNMKPLEKGISYDDDSGNHISTVDLGKSLAFISKKHHLELISFDACLMQMIEVAYEVAPYADYLLGSEETEPGDGWDYVPFMASLAKKPNEIELGVAIIDGFFDYYKGQPVTLSLVDLKKVEVMVQALKNLMPILKDYVGLSALVQKVPGYYYRENKDLGIFLKMLPKYMITNELNLYNEMVVYNKSSKPGTGLAMYMTKYPLSHYKDLRLDKELNWSTFLKNMK